MLFLLLACHGNSKDTQSQLTESGPDSSVPTCEEGNAPTLSLDTWSQAGLVPAGGVLTFTHPASGTPIYAGSHIGGAWRSDNNGQTWMALRTSTTHMLGDFALSPTDPMTIYLSSGGSLQVSHDGGNNWEQLPLGRIDQGEMLVWAIAIPEYNGQRVYAVTDEGQSYLSEDGGQTFSPRGLIPVDMSEGSSSYHFLRHVWRLLPETTEDGQVIFTDGMSIYTSDRELSSWQIRNAGHIGTHSLVRDPLNADHVLVGTTEGLLESVTGGVTFNKISTLQDDISYGAWAPDGSWLAFGSATTLYVSTDAGKTFQSYPLAWEAVEAMTILDDHRAMLSWNNGVLLSEDQGKTWVDSSAGMVDIQMSVAAPHPVCSNQVLLGSRCSGGVFSSSDWGQSWSHIPNLFHYVMSIHYDPNDSRRIWVVSDDQLVLTEDGGETWEEMLTQYHYHGFGINPEDSDYLLLGSVGSGEWKDDVMRVYRSEDGGVSWDTSSDGLPESDASAQTIAFWPGDSSVVLMGTYKGGDVSHQFGDGVGLFRSEDGGKSWTQADLPSLNIAWLEPTDAGMVAATGDGLFRSTDKGKTWEKLNGPEGFFLSVAFHGEVGVALSFDVRVWVTRDGGDSWEEISSGLPQQFPSSYLAQVAISADGSRVWATIYNQGIYELAL